MQRPLCVQCNGNPAAVNYKLGNKTYYRKICASCARKGRRVKEIPGWTRTGYKKKLTCERCNFKAKTSNQMFVFYCRIELNSNKTTWRESPLVADY